MLRPTTLRYVAIVFPGLKAKFGHFTLLFCRGRQRNVSRIMVHMHDLFSSLNFLFSDRSRWRCRRFFSLFCVTSSVEGGPVIDCLISLYLRTLKSESERCEREARGIWGWGCAFVLRWHPVLLRLYPRVQRLNKNTRK